MPQNIVDIIGNPWLALIAGVAIIMTMLALNALFSVWLERKLSGWIQRRMGPTEVGPFGLLQTVADMIKLLSKQIITPKNVDHTLYAAAPIVVFIPVVASAALLPYSKNYVFHHVDISLVMIFSFAGVGIIGIFMAGWASNNKYALLGAMRAVAQNISYEIPLILSALSIALIVSSMDHNIIVDGELIRLNGMNLAHITALQSEKGYPFIFIAPVAAIIYFIAGIAELNRGPFDIPEAESELVAGFHTEYSGMRFALFFFAEYSNMFIVAMVATALFLGGWMGPILPGPVWFILKTYMLVAAMMWVRWTFPRLRFDQLMTFCWLILVPISILNLILTAFVIKVI